MHEKKSNAGLFAAIAALVVLAVGAFFFMGGKDPGGLVITVAGPDGTEVEGVSVLVDGEVVCSSSSCKVSDLAAGTYLVKAEAEGFKKMAGKAFEVTEGKQTAVNLELIGDTSTSLEVNTKAPGLTLTLDGKKVGSLPQKLEGLEPGKHEVEIGGSDFFAPFSQTITLAEGELFTLEPELELKQGQVTVELGDGAKDAKVYLVGGGKKRPLQKLIEKGSPLLLPVDGTKYEVVATQKGFEDFAETIEFTVAEPVLTITVDMEKDAEEEDSPSSSSSAPAPARATAPAPSPSPQPAPSPAPASAPAPQPAATGAGKLNINSIPVSNVILDGRPLGTTPKIGVSVPAGNHTVVFVHPQHGRKVRSVSVSPGGVATAAVRFP